MENGNEIVYTGVKIVFVIKKHHSCFSLWKSNYSVFLLNKDIHIFNIKSIKVPRYCSNNNWKEALGFEFYLSYA